MLLELYTNFNKPNTKNHEVLQQNYIGQLESQLNLTTYYIRNICEFSRCDTCTDNNYIFKPYINCVYFLQII